MAQHLEPGLPKAYSTIPLAVGRGDASTEQCSCTNPDTASSVHTALGPVKAPEGPSSWYIIWSDDPKQHGVARGQATAGLR